MRGRETLENLLAQRSKIKVLRFLLSQNSSPITGREMSRLTGLDHKTCHKALKEFHHLGVVHMTNHSHSNFYRLNPRSYLVNKVILPLFEIERVVINGNDNGKKRRVSYE
jgi:DNA-binding IclR family transcriptional regulator